MTVIRLYKKPLRVERVRGGSPFSIPEPEIVAGMRCWGTKFFMGIRTCFKDIFYSLRDSGKRHAAVGGSR